MARRNNSGLCAECAGRMVEDRVKSIGLAPMTSVGPCRVCGRPTLMAEVKRGTLNSWFRGQQVKVNKLADLAGAAPADEEDEDGDT